MKGRGIRRALTAPLAVAVAVLLALPAVAVPGDLDPSFHGDGKVTTNFGPGVDTGMDVAIQPDGKIVVAGGAGRRFAVARYDPDGTLDHSFSGNGRTTTDLGDGIDRAQAVVIQPNGKILVAGVHDIDKDATFALARYR